MLVTCLSGGYNGFEGHAPETLPTIVEWDYTDLRPPQNAPLHYRLHTLPECPLTLQASYTSRMPPYTTGFIHFQNTPLHYRLHTLPECRLTLQASYTSRMPPYTTGFIHFQNAPLHYRLHTLPECPLTLQASYTSSR